MKLYLVMCAIFSSIIGALFFAINNNYLIIQYVPRHSKECISAVPSVTMNPRTITFVYSKNGTEQQEQREVLWNKEDDLYNARTLLTTYFETLEQEGVLKAKIPVQSVTANQSWDTLICSAAQPFWDEQQSTLQNWLILEQLLALLRTYLPRFTYLLMLVNHAPVVSRQLDGTAPWPMEGFRIPHSDLRSSRAHKKGAQNAPVIIMLNPAGDSKEPGRTIFDTFERSLTLQCAVLIEKKIKEQLPDVHLLISRVAGEIKEPYEVASSANAIPVNLYIHISMYATPEETPLCSLYAISYHPHTDSWSQDQDRAHFIPLTEAHRLHYAKNKRLLSCAFDALSTLPKIRKEAVGLIPYLPLRGLHVPAFAIECGIPAHSNIEEIASALTHLIEEILKQNLLSQ